MLVYFLNFDDVSDEGAIVRYIDPITNDEPIHDVLF